MERLLGRKLRPEEEVHHLCRNRACWPPTDFHLLLCDEAIHHAMEGGYKAHHKRKCQRLVNEQRGIER